MTRWFYASVALALAALAGSLYLFYFHLDWFPDPVPTHWGWEKADAWTPREQMFWPLLLTPLIMIGFTLLTLVLPWLSPKQFEIDRFRSVYGYMMFVIVAFVACVHVLLTLAYLGSLVDLPRWLLGGMMLFFALLGNVMGKVRRNFYVGIRTPWTLASDAVWEPTHRLGAWLLVIGGIGGFVLMMIGVPFWICFAVVIALILVPIPYSLYLYKRLEREGKLHLEPAGTSTVNEEGKA